MDGDVRRARETVNVGVTYVEGIVTGPTGKQATLRFLVDSGATYTLVPHEVSKARSCAQAHRRLYAGRRHGH